MAKPETLHVLCYLILRSDRAVIDDRNQCNYLVCDDSIAAQQRVEELPRLYGAHYQVYAFETEVPLDDFVFGSN